MLHFRTILLWLAFFLIVLQQAWDYTDNLYLGMVYRLLPSAVLLLWFLLSIFFTETEKLRYDKLSNRLKKLLFLLRPLASFTIVLGAIFKLLNWPFGNVSLAIGIALMASYSTIISIYGYSKSDEPNDIIDDLN